MHVRQKETEKRFETRAFGNAIEILTTLETL